MAILVFVETDSGVPKKTSIEAVSYAKALNEGEVNAVVLGSADEAELKKLGIHGADKVLHDSDTKFDHGIINAYATAIASAFTNIGAHTLVLAKSSLGDPVAARVAVKVKASLVSNITGMPNKGDDYEVTRSIYTGKAFASVAVSGENKILAIKKNAIVISEDGAEAPVENFSPEIPDSDFNVKISKTEKAEGDVLLPEAEIVVSGGRGLKGPENWAMIENLAKTLGAATGCSKPVSDMDWRPHHEHVGQTGVKVAPSLYIAVGISGAIQHLAGVNSSKYIVVINKDEEAPFFKAADYGIVGDAFDVVPKLTEAINAAK
jgi:electron transfer flavoprotein alpha subunit